MTSCCQMLSLFQAKYQHREYLPKYFDVWYKFYYWYMILHNTDKSEMLIITRLLTSLCDKILCVNQLLVKYLHFTEMLYDVHNFNNVIIQVIASEYTACLPQTVQLDVIINQSEIWIPWSIWIECISGCHVIM